MEIEPATKKILEVRPMGSYFELDVDGYIINPTNRKLALVGFLLSGKGFLSQ